MSRSVKLAIGLVFCLVCRHSFGQIGAEAQGGQLTFWGALGLDQTISNRWTSVTDIGYGRHSDPDNLRIFQRQGLNVLTQDLVYRLNAHWKFAFSFGYWRRNAYDELPPYNERLAPYQFRNEVRPFQRVYYFHEINRIRVSHAFRTDYRFYYNQDFTGRWSTPFEFRARYMQAWKFPLDQKQKNWIIVNDEILTAIDKYSSTVAIARSSSWSPYQITENRLSFYYRRSINTNLDLDFGVMHQYWRERPGDNIFHISYNLMFDIIIRNPFGNSTEEEEEE